MQKGGYIAKKETGKLELILLSAGSELLHVCQRVVEANDDRFEEALAECAAE